MRTPKVVFYDIETCLLLSRCFSLGKQVLRHGQLLTGYFYRTHIISITYQVNDDEPVFLHWGESEKDERIMINKFDKVIKSADIVIGKNNNRFDDKLINTERMIHDMDGIPDWLSKSDDLEKQIRKHFRLPSFSLDYLSHLLGLGGKISMEFKDWVDLQDYRMYQLAPKSTDLLTLITGRSITDIKKAGEAALNKMAKYNPKDVTDTKAVWDYCMKHFIPKFNRATYHQTFTCRTCGSRELTKNGTRSSGKTLYQRWHCHGHNGYAGQTPVNSKNLKMG